MRPLNDSEVYISLRNDPTVDMIRKVNGRVEKLHTDGYISQSTLQYLMVTNDAKELGTKWRLRVRTKATMAANSYKKMYGDNATCSNISIMSLRIFGARLETC